MKVSAHIDQAKCDGCGTCVDVCPIDCWDVTDGKASFSDPEKCMFCCFCETECPASAIKLEKIEDGL